jgi:hypothetical protein
MRLFVDTADMVRIELLATGGSAKGFDRGGTDIIRGICAIVFESIA